MSKNIIVMTTQYPGYGGAATNAYAIIKYLRNLNYNTIGIFFDETDNINVDPDNIGKCIQLSYKPILCKNYATVSIYQNQIIQMIGGQPSVVMCKNYIAPYCAKFLFPRSKIVYLVAGIESVLTFCKDKPANIILRDNLTIPKNRNETVAIDCSDIIVSNSMLTLSLLKNIYAEYESKIHPNIVDTTALVLNIKNITCKKEYDVIVTSSILTRPEKYNMFLIDILKDPSMNNYKKLIIGNDNSAFYNIPNSTISELIPHNILLNMLAKTRVLLYPSLYDSNPNTIREALHQKCLILMSNNVGGCEYYPKTSVCETYVEKEWLSKTKYLVDNYESLILNYDIKIAPCNELTALLDKID